MASELQVGTLARFSARQLAERAAERIVDAAGPQAVCICPRGIVTIEQYDDAVPDDVVGNFKPGPLVPLYLDIRDNLEHAIEVRKIVADTSHRRRGGYGEAA